MFGVVSVGRSSVNELFMRAQEQTPSYLPSYTRLGHAIPGSKTVSVGRARVTTLRGPNTLIHHNASRTLSKVS